MSNEYSVCLVMDASNNYTVEADSPDEAAQKAEEMQWQKGVSLCHQCSREVDLGDVIGAIVFQDDQEVLDTTHNAQRVADLEKERDALAAELAAIRAAGGEQVEVIGFLYEDGDILGKCDMAAGTFSLMASPDFDGNVSKLMTVTQHQRIVAAMAAELADAKSARDAYAQNAIDLQKQRDALRAELERVRQGSLFLLDAHAELEAARKQEPVAYVLFRDGEVCYESDDSIVISNTPGDETDLYKWLPVFTIPPLAGKVSVPDVCDGREQEAFEAFAKRKGMDTSMHPLHWLFLNRETYAARQGWKAAIRYCRALLATPSMEVKHGD